MKFRKTAALLLVVVMLMGVLAACDKKADSSDSSSTGTQTESQSGSSTGDDKDSTASSGGSSTSTDTESSSGTDDAGIEACEITLWHGMNGQQETTLTELTDEFNNTNEYGIKVTLVNQGYYSDLSTKLTANAAADTLPDLAQAYNNWLTSYTDKITHLDDFVANDFDDYEDIVESYREECSQFGFIHAMPFNKSTYVYFYNKTLFDELGLSAPETWADLENAGAVLMAEKNLPVVGFDDLAGMLEACLHQNGTDYISPEGALFNNEAGLETVNYIMGLYNNGYARLVGEDGYFSTVISNQMIGGYVGSSTGTSYIDTSAGWELAVAPLVGNVDKAANSAGTNLVMFSQDSNQQKAAWEYLKFMTSVDATVKWAMETGYLPIRSSAYSSSTYQDFMAGDPASTAAYAQADVFFTDPTFEGSYDIMSNVNAKIEELVLSKADGQTALDELVAAINSALK